MTIMLRYSSTRRGLLLLLVACLLMLSSSSSSASASILPANSNSRTAAASDANSLENNNESRITLLRHLQEEEETVEKNEETKDKKIDSIPQPPTAGTASGATTGVSDDDEWTDLLASILSNVFLFFLIFGLSATVEMRNLRQQLSNKFAIGCGVAMQFLIMPVLGFLSVVALRDYGITQAMGITLLVVTSSPGGSYSNWWCSTFNADLALSVAMTTVSSLLSIAMLPLNLFLYTYLAYGTTEEENVVQALDFGALFWSLAIVMSAICGGLACGYKWDNAVFHRWANRLGSLSGLLLIVFGVFLSSGADGAESNFWNMEWAFYVAVAFPCLLGICLANIIARSLKLSPPETVAISIECCYQNTGIATSVAITMFDDPEERAQAVAVPLFYGVVEAVAICIYCIWAWKVGWTKAPANENFCIVVATTYEVAPAADQVDENDDAENEQDVEVASGDAAAVAAAAVAARAGSSEMDPSDCFTNEPTSIHVSDEGILVVPNNVRNDSTNTAKTTMLTDSMQTTTMSGDDDVAHKKPCATPASSSLSPPRGHPRQESHSQQQPRTFWSRMIPAFLRPRTHSSSTESTTSTNKDRQERNNEDNDDRFSDLNDSQYGGSHFLESSYTTPSKQKSERKTAPTTGESSRSRLVSDFTAETTASSNPPPTPLEPATAAAAAVGQETETSAMSCADPTTGSPAAHLSIPSLQQAQEKEEPSSPTRGAAAAAAAPPPHPREEDDELSALSPTPAAKSQGQSKSHSVLSSSSSSSQQQQSPMDRRLSGSAYFM